MSFISKPKVLHTKLPKNQLGLTIREYEGSMSTLCAGCGHEFAALPQTPVQGSKHASSWASPRSKHTYMDVGGRATQEQLPRNAQTGSWPLRPAGIFIFSSQGSEL